jgi:hypothetical protein
LNLSIPDKKSDCYPLSHLDKLIENIENLDFLLGETAAFLYSSGSGSDTTTEPDKR